MHIITITNLEVGDTFSLGLQRGEVGYRVLTVSAPLYRADEYRVTVPVDGGLSAWGGTLTLLADMPVFVDGPVRVRPLRHDVAPNNDALDVSTPSAAWSPLASVGSSALHCGDDIGRADRAYRANGATTECDGDADWRV